MNKNKTIFFFIAGVLSLSSCISSSKVRYIQAEKTIRQDKFILHDVVYLVQPGDNLYVKLSSTEPATGEILKSESGGDLSQGFAARYKDVYLVDQDGFISLPQLAKIKVSGLSLEQIKDSVDFKMKRYYAQASSQIRLADNYVTIIGDVNSPGRYLIDFNDKISIFELIGMAGDLTYEAKRSDVKLIRKQGDETQIYTINLTKRTVLESEFYYILPNDVVYVEPLKAVSWHSRSFPFATSLALLLSTTSAILVILSYFK